MKKTKEKPKKDESIVFVVIFIIAIAILGALWLTDSDKSETTTREAGISQTTEYCTRLATEAEDKKTNCKLAILEELYGIAYSPDYVVNGGSCFYFIPDSPPDGSCLKLEMKNYYLNLAEESCDKSFPKKEDVFAECLSKIK